MRRILSALGIAALGLGLTAVVGGTASATASCPLNSGKMCLYSDSNFKGTQWNYTSSVCWPIGTVKYLPASFKDEANSATNSDQGNFWAIYNERSGVLSDTLIVRLSPGSSISQFNSLNTADYIKTY